MRLPVADNPGIDKKPSFGVAVFRWPLALAALGKLLDNGDRKHRLNENQGLTSIEDHYDWRYSWRKFCRHALRWASGEELDAEMKVPHPVCMMWHAINLCDSWLREKGYTLEQFQEAAPTEAQAHRVPVVGDRVSGPGTSSGVIRGPGVLVEVTNNGNLLIQADDDATYYYIRSEEIEYHD